MDSEGLERIVRAEDVAMMGITEVVRHMPRIYGEYRKLVAAIKARRPQVAILIDFPDVNFRLARELKKLDIPVIYFVSPQLWAWKRSRLRWVQQRVSRMMVIFPFEAAFYRARNVDAEFVGHPLAMLPMPNQARAGYAELHGLDPARQWIALLPGSRRKEVHLNLPKMLEAAALLAREQPYEFLLPVASTIGYPFIQAALLDSAVARNLHITLVDDARSALHHARASIVASGTATVQAAIIGNPFLVVYQVSGLTFKLARHLIRYPPEIPAPRDADGHLPIAMVNLIAGKRIVPEFLQGRFTASNLVAALTPLLAESQQRETMMAELMTVHRSLLPNPGSNPIHRVCDAVQSLLEADRPISAASV